MRRQQYETRYLRSKFKQTIQMIAFTFNYFFSPTTNGHFPAGRVNFNLRHRVCRKNERDEAVFK